MRNEKKMNYRIIIILMPLWLLFACVPEQEEAPADTTSSEAVATIAAPPTAASAVEAAQTSQPDPTAAPDPTSEPEAIPSQGGGTAGFRDNLATADQFVLELTGVPNPPEAQIYQGWLLTDDGSIIHVGELNVGGDGSVSLSWNSPDSENLLGRTSRFQVTLEATPGADSPGGPVVLAGGLEGETLASARQLFVKNVDEPATPLNTAFAAGLVAQTDVALQHVENAINAAAIGALPEMRSHLEHIINIIEGAAGPRFGDHDGNGNAENPGDGFGVLAYSEQIATLLADRPDVVEAAATVQELSAAAQDSCFEILGLQDMAAASAQLESLKSLANELRADLVTRLYQAAQSGVDFDIMAVEE